MKSEPKPPVEDTPEPDFARVGAMICWLSSGDKRRLIDPHRRVLVGSSRRCGLRLEGKGVARRHVKISSQADGSLFVFPVQGASFRVDGVRHHKPTRVPAGATLGFGLHEVATGNGSKNFAHDLRLAWQNGQDDIREIREHLPWLAISLVVHLLLLILTYRQVVEIPDGNGDGTLAVDMAKDGNDESAEDDSEDETREAYPEFDAPEAELEDPTDANGDSDLDGGAAMDADDGMGAGSFASDLDASTYAALTTKLRRSDDTKKPALRRSSSDGTQEQAPPLPKTVSKKFRKTVAGLRRSGLEIVFCFDSTYSMEPVLSDAKADLLELFELVQELVPRSRMGIVTYRDHGDDYVTRATRLGIGRFEALAFLSSVRADGGGDYPEAVDEALLLASRFPWRSGARKITIVVGDAPPRPKRMRRALATAKKMSRRNGQVHVLVTRQYEAAEPLARIARAGGGRFLPRQDRDQLALQLLTFALGPESDTDLRKLLEQRRHRAELRRRKRSASTIPNIRILAGTLEKERPDAVVVEAWTWARGRVISQLPSVLAKRRFGREGVLAMYYLVNRLLERHGRTERVAPPKLPTPRTGMPPALRKALLLTKRRGARRG